MNNKYYIFFNTLKVYNKIISFPYCCHHSRACGPWNRHSRLEIPWEHTDRTLPEKNRYAY